MASSSAYYSNEEAVICRETDVEGSTLTQVSTEKLDEIYEIDRCVKYIKEQRCIKVALQFPDSMLVDASNVAWQLGKNCDAKIYILADTSYGHCDIDEVNAKHVDADLLIHYGESSLTPSATIPTLFVFGRHPAAIVAEEVCNVFSKTFPEKSTTRVVFLHHVTCHYIADEISSKLLPDYPYLSVGQLNIPKDPGGATGDSKHDDDENVLKDLCTKSCPGCSCRLENGGDKDKSTPKEDLQKEPSNSDQTKNSDITYSVDKDKKSPTLESSNGVNKNSEMDVETTNGIRPVEREEQTTSAEMKIISNRSMAEDMDDSHQPDCKEYRTGFYTISLELDKEFPDYSIFYLGPKNAESLRNLMLSHPSCEVHVYDPTSGYEKIQLNTNRQLMKRYYLVEKAKDALIVGILVGTMGVAGYLECLNYMKKLAKSAGKKSYTFIMGKLTPEKLANFLEIDLYVLVANPEHSICDASNFYRPVVTPYEFDVACNPNREWSGNYITDFRRILPGGSDYVELPSDRSMEEPTISLITGNIRTNIDSEDSLHDTEMASEIALRNEKTDLAVFGANSSAHRLSERSWQGLEQKLSETPVTKAKQGRSGIPVSYNEKMDF